MAATATPGNAGPPGSGLTINGVANGKPGNTTVSSTRCGHKCNFFPLLFIIIIIDLPGGQFNGPLIIEELLLFLFPL